MSVQTKKRPHGDNSTQRYLPFSEIRENVMIMKDGSARLVLRCSTVNFLLKSSEEQDAIIMSYQRFLNSLEFPIQILIRSTKLDIEGYLSNLNARALKQENFKLQRQTYEYIDYLKKLVEVAQIMRKEFYLVIPFDYVENKSVRDTGIMWMFSNFWASINWSVEINKIKSNIKGFDKIKKWLNTRANHIKTSLENIWLKATELDKTELVKLMIDYYNPSLDNLEASKNFGNNDLL